MRAVRVLRIVIPLLLLPFIGVVVWQWQDRPGGPVRQRPRESFGGARVERLELVDIEGVTVRGSVQAEVVEQMPDGGVRLQGIERLEIERSGGAPLVIRAERGAIGGDRGGRQMVFEGGVEIGDPDAGLELSLAAVEVDESAGEVRSRGEVQLASQTLRGRAASVVYGLRGQPARLAEPELQTDVGQRLTAQRAILHDGADDVEFTGRVKVEGDEGAIEARSMRLLRTGGGGQQRAIAQGEVSGRAITAGGPPLTFRAPRAELDWDDTGGVRRVLLDGGASVHQERSSLSAESIEAEHPPDSAAAWDVHARGTARAASVDAEGAPAVITAQEIEARLLATGELADARARGGVRFRSGITTAEGDRGETVAAGGGPRRAVLHGGPGARKAQMTSGRTRVAADRLETADGGGTLVAEGRVEATLLPDPARTSRAGPGLFEPGQAVHFVASRLVATDQGDRLTFTGGVRGWQGDRSLAAATVEMDRVRDAVDARGKVTTRLPARGPEVVSGASVIQVSAERLEYAGQAGRGVYSGGVRVRQAEGWLDSQRLEATLEEGELRQLLATGDVSFEMRGRRSAPTEPPVTGTGDRALFHPAESLVRLFGDRAPAVVRREGARGGVTSGRVLRYRLDTGSLEVESGERDRGRIQTTGK